MTVQSPSQRSCVKLSFLLFRFPGFRLKKASHGFEFRTSASGSEFLFSRFELQISGSWLREQAPGACPAATSPADGTCEQRCTLSSDPFLSNPGHHGHLWRSGPHKVDRDVICCRCLRSRFRVWDSAFGIRVSGVRCWVRGFWVARFAGVRCEGLNLGLRVRRFRGMGARIQGLGCECLGWGVNFG